MATTRAEKAFRGAAAGRWILQDDTQLSDSMERGRLIC